MMADLVLAITVEEWEKMMMMGIEEKKIEMEEKAVFGQVFAPRKNSRREP